MSSQSDDKGQQETVLRGEAQIVFIGPELLLKNATWREMLRTPIYRTNLVAFVIDEVHCVTKWYVAHVSSSSLVFNDVFILIF